MQGEDSVCLHARDAYPACGSGCKHGRFVGAGRGCGDGQGIDGPLDDHDDRVAVQAVVGWPVERGRLVEGRRPCRVSVLGCLRVAGHVSADESVDAFGAPQYRDDQPATVGIDKFAVAGPLGEVELQQFLLADTLTEQMPGQGAPVSPRVANNGLTASGRAQRPDVDSTGVAQVGLRDADVGRGREELPSEKVDGVGTFRCGRELSGDSWPLELRHGGRRHAAERGALLKCLNGVDEGEPGEPVDVLDDVTARATPEAMEPVGYAANGQ